MNGRLSIVFSALANIMVAGLMFMVSQSCARLDTVTDQLNGIDRRLIRIEATSLSMNDAHEEHSRLRDRISKIETGLQVIPHVAISPELLKRLDRLERAIAESRD